MGWLQKLPIVSVLFAVAIAAVPFWGASVDGGVSSQFETSRARARTFLVRNPQLEVDTLGELVLDPSWLSEMRSAAENADASGEIELPPRMLARSQARLDGLIASAHELRIQGDPTWRFGVLDARSPGKNYFAHAFVNDNKAGIVLGVIVLLLVGAALELTWGSLIFAAFATAVIPLTAYGYRFLDASSGLPWSGAAGLAGALLGAYFIRGLGGHFMIPGWLLLPVWLGVESFVVRGIGIDDLGSVPWASFCAAVGVGALVAGGLRLMNIESKLESHASKRTRRGPNPVVARAARLRSDGDPYQAFDLIQAAWREDPTCEDIADAFFSIAVEVGQPEAAADAIMPSLRFALKRGDVARAVDYWLPLASRECEVRLDATVAVRLGEALLDAKHPDEALFTMRCALDTGVSAAQAVRIVNVARDLDEGVARQAAVVALNDAGLDPKLRAELEPLADLPDESPVDVDPTPIAESNSQLDRRVHAEHQAIETTAFPIGSDADLESNSDAIGEGDASLDPNEESLHAQGIDAGAFSEDNLSADPIPDHEAPPDVLSHWNEDDPLAADETTADLGVAANEDPLFDATALESREDDIDFGLDLADSELLGPLDSETDTDLTPLIDATDELTSPLVGEGSDPSDPAEGRTTAVFDQPTEFFESGAGAPVGTSRGGSPGASLRAMKALDAVPIAMSEESIEIDASPRGKSKVPFTRIQTIAMAAVEGLGDRPVLVVDLVLNGSDSVEEPMKLIRFRSDRFDPLGFEPAAENPLAALLGWVGRLQAKANAICLPSREILDGNFSRFASLDDYERRVLTASREYED